MTLQSHLVTDRRRLGLDADALVQHLARAPQRGVDYIHVRERDLDDRDLVSLVRRVVAAVKDTRTRVLVNDRPDIAVAGGAHGVHLRADSAAAHRVRSIVPSTFLVGRSVHTLDEIDAATAAGGCDYLLFGTVFPSAGKSPGHPVAGLAALTAACRRSTVPVIAIGGIDATRLPDLEKSGAAGFAAVGMFG